MTKVIRAVGLWNIIIGLVFTAILGICGWGIAKVTTIPEKYVTKEADRFQRQELSSQICDLKNDINTKLDRATDEFNAKLNGVHSRIGGMDDRMEKSQTKIESQLDKLQSLVIKHMITTDKKNGG